MSRTVEEIETSIQDQINAESSLNGLTSTSNTAIYILWKKLVALAIWTLEGLWDIKERELDAKAEAAVAGTVRWYAERILDFQYNYQLAVVDGVLKYLILDEDAKLVEQTAIRVITGVLVIKVAKDSGGGVLGPLSSAELVSLESYVNAIKFAGTEHLLVSEDPDQVWVSLDYYYDGKLDAAEVQTEVEAAITAYLNSIPFDGVFNINQFRDAVEALASHVDTDNINIQIRENGAASYTNVVREYDPVSGYYVEDPDKLMANEINYIPV